ncbi:MAG TPA: alpha-galactosidase [Enterococcus columbae]|nr:alpha-galactosidase [Enterococcus columbae]
MIIFDEQTRVFHLTNEKISYLIQIEDFDYVTHLYFGKKIGQYSNLRKYRRIDRAFSPNPEGWQDRCFSLDTMLMEYPAHGGGDFREPAINLKFSNGSRVSDFRYDGYQIIQGKPALAGLPATYVTADDQAETLELYLVDALSQLRLTLSYTIFANQAVITRHTKLENLGAETVAINRLASGVLDFYARDLEVIQLNGAWGHERQMTREAIYQGIKVYDSKRGASSHEQNPFVALVEPTTTEFTGEAIGCCLVYSGNHEAVIQQDHYRQTRVIMGINSYDFAWQLKPKECFVTPEVVYAYSDAGLNQMSATFHDLFNQHLVRGNHQFKERPTLINNWEATYFDFNEEKIMEIVNEAKDLGIEMFVLDDGWFGERDDDYRSLGDWFEYEEKINLQRLAEQVHAKGMKFGLWVEPEMISANSRLHEQHPDWVLHVPNRGRSLSRSQHVLDFSREDVRENIYQQLKAIFDRVPVDYVKWDMNRNMTEVYSLLLSPECQGEVAHRYILGLYAFLERLVNEYPNILFESCSGGGGRFDAGMLYYMPQTWTSDNTDAIARLNIQYGTSLVYPISTMGSHVSAVPNHQTHRKTSLAIRGNVAMSGVFGYELDLTKLTEEEKAEIKEQLVFYKAHRRLFQFGRFIRLVSPFDHNTCAWMFVDEQQDEAIVFYFRKLAQASSPVETIRLAGLDPEKVYTLNGNEITGAECMYLGLYIDETLMGDYATQMFHLKAK